MDKSILIAQTRRLRRIRTDKSKLVFYRNINPDDDISKEFLEKIKELSNQSSWQYAYIIEVIHPNNDYGTLVQKDILVTVKHLRVPADEGEQPMKVNIREWLTTHLLLA